MKKHLLLFLSVAVFTTPAFSQLLIDKSISLTGSGSDAKISGIEVVSDAQDALSVEAFQSGTFVYGGVSGGSSTAYTVTLTPAIAAYTNGLMLYFKAHTACGAGPVTINVNGSGTRTIKKNGSLDLAAGDITNNQVVSIIYDGTNFHLLSQIGTATTGSGTTNQLAKWSSSSHLTSSLVFDNGTNVGIGTTSPSVKLHVVGDEYVSRLYTTGNNTVDPGNPMAADIVIGSVAGTRHDASMMWWSNSSASRISNTGDVFYLSVWNTTNANIALAATVGSSSYFQGNVGIGTTSPGARLEVGGQVKITGGSPAANKVLTSDATGLATWQYSGVPVGSVFHLAASSVPPGYLECNGAQVSRTTYAALFATIGTTYGAGNGSTTFNLPDLRGEFIRGFDNGRGADSGRTFGTAQQATGISDQVYQTVYTWFDNADSGPYGHTNYNTSGGYAGTTRTFVWYKVRPRNVAMLPVIKF